MQGLSLWEMLIALVVIIVLAQFALPPLGHLLEKEKGSILLMELREAIQSTQQLARNRHEIISFCHSENHMACDHHWQGSAWLIFSDNYLDGVVHANSFVKNITQKLIHGKLKFHAFPAGRPFLRFLPSGFTDANNGTFWYCPEQSNKVIWAIMVNKAGRARVTYPDASGAIIDSRGRRLEC